MYRLALLHQARRIVKLAAPPPWIGPLIVLSGVITALLEAMSLFLFIPLIESLIGAPATSARLPPLPGLILAFLPEANGTSFVLVILCIVILLKNGTVIVGVWLSHYLDGLVSHRLRVLIFDQTISSCVDYRRGAQRSDIANRIDESAYKVGNALRLVCRIIVCAFTLTIFLIVMAVISIRLTLAAIVFLVLIAFAVRGITRRASRAGRNVVDENKKFSLRMWESIYSLQLIRSFGREDYEGARFRNASNQVRRHASYIEMLWATPGSVLELSIVAMVAVLVLASQSLQIGLPATAAFLSLLYRLQAPTREMMEANVALGGLSSTIDDVEDFIVSTAQPHLTDGNAEAAPFRESLIFTDVSFRYSEDESWILQNVSITIPANKTTAIIGRSGAGKSTIISLMLRFQDPTEGEITADGVPLPQFHIPTWRKQLALMSQDVQLFNDTIEANIGYGDLGASLDDIRAAAVIAHADDFIRALPQCYRTVVGDSGMRLSGGQRQRIALARTILYNPAILILDEATSDLDIETQRAFQLALEKYASQRTLVVVTHRLSTVELADQIIVLEDGRVVEAGPPDQLLDRKGHFARLHHLDTAGPALR
jgi:subfamily B ATP-binding cassette protein MsbA